MKTVSVKVTFRLGWDAKRTEVDKWTAVWEEEITKLLHTGGFHPVRVKTMLPKVKEK